MSGSAATTLSCRAQRVLPGGVNSNARLPSNDVVLVRGDGPYVWDSSGRRYIDYVLGRGPAFLGHAPPRVVAEVHAAEKRGMCLGATTAAEIEAAEALVDFLDWPDMVRFASSGTEANQLALRIARAATGRQKIVQFQDHYHGWVDSTFVTTGRDRRVGPRARGQSGGAMADTIVLPWNDVDSLRAVFDQFDANVAAVIMEPLMMNGHGTFPAPGFLAEVKAEVHARGALLVFDEVVTGVRLGKHGGAGAFGVVPDLAVYAKAIGSGWPVAAVAGPTALMATMADGSTGNNGTYNGNSAAMAAVLATIEVLQDGAPYAHVEALGALLMKGLTDAAEAAGIPLHIRGFPAAFFTNFLSEPASHEPHHEYRPDSGRFTALSMRIRGEGVWLGSRGSWYVSTVHDRQNIQETVDAFATALGGM